MTAREGLGQAEVNTEEAFLMFRIRLVGLDTTAATVPDATGSVTHSKAPAPSTILLTVNLAEGTQHTVFVTNLAAQVAKSVLTATGTVNIPGRGRDSFTAVLWAVDTSDKSVMLTIGLGSLRRDPLCLVADVSPLLDGKVGAGSAANYLSDLLSQFLSGRGP
jgi:hypothetical protein